MKRLLPITILMLCASLATAGQNALPGLMAWKATQATTGPLETDLALWYNIDIGSDVAWYQDVQYANTLVGIIAPGTTAAKISGLSGDAFDGDGNANSAIGINYTSGLGNAMTISNANWTCSVWVYFERNTTERIFMLGIGSSFRENSKVYLQGGLSGTTVVFVNYSGTGEWKHFVWTHDGDGVKMYVDGIYSAEDTTGTWAGAPAQNPCLSSPDFPLQGQMDEYQIYSRELSSNEVFSIYSNPTSVLSSCTVHWTFDGLGAIPDDSGSGNVGTLKTGTMINNTDGFWEFDGVNDYVSCGNVGAIKTISMWVYPDVIASMKLVNIDGTDQIETDASGDVQATSFPAATVYVNGAAATRLTISEWNHVVIVDTTGVTASTLELGRVSTSYYNGSMDDVRISTNTITSGEVSTLYGLGRQ